MKIHEDLLNRWYKERKLCSELLSLYQTDASMLRARINWLDEKIKKAENK